jgi:hypothetical protein
MDRFRMTADGRPKGRSSMYGGRVFERKKENQLLS